MTTSASRSRDVPKSDNSPSTEVKPPKAAWGNVLDNNRSSSTSNELKSTGDADVDKDIESFYALKRKLM